MAELGHFPSLALDGLLIAALAWAVVTDLRSRRISNRLTYPTAALGLALHAATGGWGGLTWSAIGLLVGLAAFLLPFLLGGMGGGDVKLMAAIGALQGPQFALQTAIYAGLAGGVLAVGSLLRRRRPAGATPGAAVDQSGGVRPAAKGAGSIPYAPAIAAGAALVLLRLALGGL